MVNLNPILLTDSYKTTHWLQYPPGTTHVYSYFESRGGMFPETVFFGLQYYLDTYLNRPVSEEDIAAAEVLLSSHLGTGQLFNLKGWEHIVKDHKGYLPVHIKAVPEGMVVPTNNVLMTAVNTCPQCFWVTNYIETLLVQVWYGTTVATLSRAIKRLILQFLTATGDPELIGTRLHDFGFRGVSSVESAAIGGLAHLVNFQGTDTLPPLLLAQQHYGCPMAGFSIPASEHSTMTSWGQEGEVAAFGNMIAQYGDLPLYACVSDSYDIWRACRQFWGEELRDRVKAAKGTLVVRPDSGIPHEVVVKCLEILGEKFGTSLNAKGYKLLHPKVRLIQGDGVDYEAIRRVLTAMKLAGWSADNVAFGMGGALLQKLHRDTNQFAFKCSAVTVNGVDRDVSKAPVTDNGKASKPGRLSLMSHLHTGNGWKTVAGADHPRDVLVPVFENGRVLQRWTLDEIRERAKVGL